MFGTSSIVSPLLPHCSINFRTGKHPWIRVPGFQHTSGRVPPRRKNRAAIFLKTLACYDQPKIKLKRSKMSQYHHQPVGGAAHYFNTVTHTPAPAVTMATVGGGGKGNRLLYRTERLFHAQRNFQSRCVIQLLHPNSESVTASFQLLPP